MGGGFPRPPLGFRGRALEPRLALGDPVGSSRRQAGVAETTHLSEGARRGEGQGAMRGKGNRPTTYRPLRLGRDPSGLARLSRL
jgi:hypothetical protein